MVAVYEDRAVANDQLLAWEGDHTLDEVLGVVGRWAEDDDVPPLGCMEPIGDLVGDEVIVVVEGREHRQTFDMHRLHGEADAEVQDDCKYDDLGELTEQRRAGRNARWIS